MEYVNLLWNGYWVDTYMFKSNDGCYYIVGISRENTRDDQMPLYTNHNLLDRLTWNSISSLDCREYFLHIIFAPN